MQNQKLSLINLYKSILEDTSLYQNQKEISIDVFTSLVNSCIFLKKNNNVLTLLTLDSAVMWLHAVKEYIVLDIVYNIAYKEKITNSIKKEFHQNFLDLNSNVQSSKLSLRIKELYDDVECIISYLPASALQETSSYTKYYLYKDLKIALLHAIWLNDVAAMERVISASDGSLYSKFFGEHKLLSLVKQILAAKPVLDANKYTVVDTTNIIDANVVLQK